MAELTVSGVTWEGDTGEDLVTYKDRSGNELKYQVVDGVNVSVFFPRRFIEQTKGLKLRQDDVYLVGFPRTGTNWTNEITRMLLNRKAETIPEVKPHIEMIAEEDLDKIPSPRVLNAHVKMSEAPADLKEKKCKVIFTLRDPKDAAVSCYNMIAGRPWNALNYKGTFNDYFYLFFEGKVDFNGIFEHWRSAEKYFDENPDVPVHYQVYEETLKNPVLSVQRLSDFLGLQRNDKLCEDIAKKCEFKTLKADKDPYTLKYNDVDILYRQGNAGDWRNHFNEDLLDDYYKMYEEKMAGWKFFELYARNA